MFFHYNVHNSNSSRSSTSEVRMSGAREISEVDFRLYLSIYLSIYLFTIIIIIIIIIFVIVEAFETAQKKHPTPT